MIDHEMIRETVGRIHCPCCWEMTIHVPDEGFTMQNTPGLVHDPECPLVCVQCGRVWAKGRRIKFVKGADGNDVPIPETFHQISEPMRRSARIAFLKDQVVQRDRTSEAVDMVDTLNRGRRG